jgi:hypothetical protein
MTNFQFRLNALVAACRAAPLLPGVLALFFSAKGFPFPYLLVEERAGAGRILTLLPSTKRTPLPNPLPTSWGEGIGRLRRSSVRMRPQLSAALLGACGAGLFPPFYRAE